MLYPTRLFALLLLALLTNRAAAQTTSPADSLTQNLQRVAETGILPGFAVAVVDSGGVRYEAGFGLADRVKKQPFTAVTVQGIGSVSKTFIGVALLKAQEMGLFTLDAEINAILPFAVVNPHGTYRPMRVIDLATHTSGILDREKPYLATYQWGARGEAFTFDAAAAAPARYAPAAMAAWLRAYLTPGKKPYAKANFAAAAPGAEYHYSNVGSALAAYLIELKSGLSYAAFVRQHILQPAAMTAGWTRAEVAAAPHATGYSAKGKPYPSYFGLTYPDGGLHASAHDLALYLTQIIRGAEGGKGGLLTPSGFQELLRPRFTAGAVPGGVPKKEPNTGVFWAMRANGEVGHIGSDPGVFVAMFFDPKTGIGRVFMTNVDFDDNPAAVQQFAAVWRGLMEVGPRLPAGRR